MNGTVPTNMSVQSIPITANVECSNYDSSKQNMAAPNVSATPVPKLLKKKVNDITYNEAGWDYSQIKPYKQYIIKWANIYKINPKLVAAVILTESGGHKWTVTPAGNGMYAVGLMQVIAYRANGFSDRPTIAQLKNPDINIKWGCKIMAYTGARANPYKAMYYYSGGTAWKSWSIYETYYWKKVVYFYKLLWGED